LSNLVEIMEYKNKLMKLLIISPTIVNAIDPSKADCSDELIWENIFPMYVYPKTEDEVKTYICVVLSVPNVRDNVYKNVTIMIHIFTHVSKQRTSNGYVLTDFIQSEVDKLLNGSAGFGIGDLRLKSVTPLQVSPNHCGSTLTYINDNFNNQIIK